MKGKLGEAVCLRRRVMGTNRAMELMGSYGYMKECDVEKYWRDCKVLQLVEGGARLGRLDIIREYYA